MPPILRSPRFPFAIMLGACVFLFAGGMVFAHWMRLAACPLCIIQRMIYLLLALLAIMGLALADRQVGRRLAALGMTAAAAAGVVASGYQTWIQRFAPSTTCGAEMPWWEELVEWAGQQAPALFLSTGLCSDPGWKFLGLSIAEWSLLAFFGMFCLSLWVVVARQK